LEKPIIPELRWKAQVWFAAGNGKKDMIVITK
jgi:hypothetical protein